MKNYNINIILFLFISLSTIPLATYCGFYWDDWPFHSFMFHGSYEDIYELFGHDRPLNFYIKYFQSLFFDSGPVFFQVCLVLSKIIFSLSIYYFFKQLKVINDNVLVALIPYFVFFYPGFSQDSISLTYWYRFISLSFYISSIILSYRLLLRRNKNNKALVMYIISFLFMIIPIFHGEFNLGLEVYRVILIYYGISPGFSFSKNKIKRFFNFMFPYLSISLAFLTYRIFIFENLRPALSATMIFENIKSNPLQQFVDIFIRLISDTYESLIGVWANALIKTNISITAYNDNIHLENIVFTPKIITILSIFIIFTSISIGIFLHIKNSKSDLVTHNHKRGHFLVIFSILGVLSLIFVWVGMRQIILDHQYDRYTTGIILSSISFLLFFLQSFYYRYIIAFTILGFSITTHIINRIEYAADWQNQKSFFEQVYWRFPDIEKGSLIVIDGMDFILQRDKSLAVPLNYIYSENLDVRSPDYWIDFSPEKLHSKINFSSKDTVFRLNDLITFTSDPKKVLRVNFNNNSCLKIRYPGRRDLDYYYLTNNENYLKNNHQSELNRTNIDLPQNILNIFGPDFGKKDCWCYFFEKADYHYSNEDWLEVLNIFNRVIDTNYRPADKREWLIFYESAKILNEMKVIDLIEKMVYGDKNSHLFNLNS